MQSGWFKKKTAAIRIRNLPADEEIIGSLCGNKVLRRVCEGINPKTIDAETYKTLLLHLQHHVNAPKPNNGLSFHFNISRGRTNSGPEESKRPTIHFHRLRNLLIGHKTYEHAEGTRQFCKYTLYFSLYSFATDACANKALWTTRYGSDEELPLVQLNPNGGEHRLGGTIPWSYPPMA